jgi:hypothetical protein
MKKLALFSFLIYFPICIFSMVTEKKSYPWTTTNPFFQQNNRQLFEPARQDQFTLFKPSYEITIDLSANIFVVINKTSDKLTETHFLKNPIEWMTEFNHHGYEQNLACQALRQRTIYFHLNNQSYCTKNEELSAALKIISKRKKVLQALSLAIDAQSM